MASNIVFDGTKGISLPSFTTTEKNAIVSPATGATVFDTTQNRQNVYAGGVWNAGLNSGTAVASTSGTSIDFTSIPSWVKRITVMFNAVSTNGSSGFRIRLGYGSTPTYITTGYNASGAYISSGTATTSTGVTDGFFVGLTTAAAQSNWGSVVITNIDSNNWTYTSILGSTSGIAGYGAGNLNMSSNVLTAVRITTTGGTDTFDNGTINILYE